MTPDERATAVARIFLDAAERVHAQSCPACQAKVRASGWTLTRTPCAEGDCPDLTPERRAWIEAHRSAPRRRRGRA